MTIEARFCVLGIVVRTSDVPLETQFNNHRKENYGPPGYEDLDVIHRYKVISGKEVAHHLLRHDTTAGRNTGFTIYTSEEINRANISIPWKRYVPGIGTKIKWRKDFHD